MEPLETKLQPHLQKAVDMGATGLDILHGELKNLMYEAEREYEAAVEEEERTEEAMDSMERKFWEGQLEALGMVYALTYRLSFAIADRGD